MYAAGTCQAHEVKLLAGLLGVAVSLDNLLVLEDRTVSAGAVDFHEVLIHDASCTDIEVTHLRVTHLSVGQTYIFARSEKL